MTGYTLSLPVAQLCKQGEMLAGLVALGDARSMWSSSVSTGLETYLPSDPFYGQPLLLVDSKVLTGFQYAAGATVGTYVAVVV